MKIKRVKSLLVGVFFASIVCIAPYKDKIGHVKASDMSEMTENEARESISRIITEMESVMQKSYNEEADNLVSCGKQGYDYDLTSQSFYNQGLPYANFDYVEFIAVYATIQEYCMENGIDMEDGINKVDFVNAEFTPSTITEYVPKDIDKYKKNENGTFEKDGTVTITEPCDVMSYSENDDGTFSEKKMEHIDLETKETSYAEVKLNVISKEDLYKTFGLNAEDFKEIESQKLEKLKKAIGQGSVGETIFIENSMAATDDQKQQIQHALDICTTDEQKQIISIASTLINRVPYEWGGKSDKEGYDDTWYTFDETGRQKGLDCSGYVQWVMRTAHYSHWEEMQSTAAMLGSSNLTQINMDELMPGDLGFFYEANSGMTNHVGIYLGDGYWIHCNSSANTVSISTNEKFSIFRRFLGIEPIDLINADENLVAGVLAPEEPMIVNNVEVPDSDVMTMAKIVQCEALGEGYNGWVAVAQVIKNRAESSAFKASTIYDVCSAPGQFSTWRKASHMSDSSVNQSILHVCEEVLKGNVKVFEENVIGFKRDDGDEHWNGWNRISILGNHAFYVL